MENEAANWLESTKAIPVDEEKQKVTLRARSGQIDHITEALIASPIGIAIGYNELESAPYVRGMLPWANRSEFRRWQDVDDSHLFAYLQTNFDIKNEQAIRHALAIANERNRFNPIIDMFASLPKWDEKRRAGYLLHRFLGAEDNAYTQAVERLIFSGAIMRTYHPGTKFDYMPVVTGEQGCGKSTLIRMMALMDEFFTDCLTGIGTKEGAELVQGKLLVEISELDALRGKH